MTLTFTTCETGVMLPAVPLHMFKVTVFAVTTGTTKIPVFHVAGSVVGTLQSTTDVVVVPVTVSPVAATQVPAFTTPVFTVT